MESEQRIFEDPIYLVLLFRQGEVFSQARLLPIAIPAKVFTAVRPQAIITMSVAHTEIINWSYMLPFREIVDSSLDILRTLTSIPLLIDGIIECADDILQCP